MPSDLIVSNTDHGADPTPSNADHRAAASGGRGPLIAVVLAALVTAGAVVWMVVAGGSGSTESAPISGDDELVVIAAEPPASPADTASDDSPEPSDMGADSVTVEQEDDASEPVVPDAAVPEPEAEDQVPDDEVTFGSEDEDAEPATEGEVGAVDVIAQPQSRAVFRDGQVVLFGKVPSREIADDIFDLAASLLGPENVVDDYEIDPTVPPPTTGNLTVEETIEFTSGAAVLPDPVPDILPIGAALLEIRPTARLRIIGHTDGRGSEEANLRLSLERAEAVKAWLVDQGIDPERIEAVGFGEAFPVASDDTEAGRRENRRIEFEVQNILGEG